MQARANKLGRVRRRQGFRFGEGPHAHGLHLLLCSHATVVGVTARLVAEVRDHPLLKQSLQSCLTCVCVCVAISWSSGAKKDMVYLRQRLEDAAIWRNASFWKYMFTGTRMSSSSLLSFAGVMLRPLHIAETHRIRSPLLELVCKEKVKVQKVLTPVAPRYTTHKSSRCTPYDGDTNLVSPYMVARRCCLHEGSWGSAPLPLPRRQACPTIRER
jgi:hypothetical protein